MTSVALCDLEGHTRRACMYDVCTLLNGSQSHTQQSDLHWLRVPERIKFRLAVHVFRCRHNMAPPYLSRDFHWTDEAESLQRLRSGSQPRLIVPRSRLRTIGDRCFRVMAARAWNSLPTSVTTATSLFSFKRQLKTFFSQSRSQNYSLIVYRVLEALLLMQR